MVQFVDSHEGTGYLVENPEVIRAVDSRFPAAEVLSDGTWRADPKVSDLGRIVPEPWGRDCVVYCADQFYFPGLVASMRSLLYLHPAIPVIVISWGLTPSQELYLSKFATVVQRRIDLPDDPVWGRLSLFHLDIRQAVYLDADTIVIQPIDALLSQKAAFAAARNLDWGIKENFKNVGFLQSLNLDPDLPAFNSGVFVVDVPYWGTDLYDRVLDLENRFGHQFLLGDQSALNLAFALSPANDVTWLAESFNAIVEFWDPGKASERARILHYAGPCKPWNHDYMGPMREAFFQWSKIPSERKV